MLLANNECSEKGKFFILAIELILQNSVPFEVIKQALEPQL
jgi:hypothetical protein